MHSVILMASSPNGYMSGDDPNPDNHSLMDLDLDEPGLSDRFDIFMPAVQSLVNAIGGFETVESPPGSGKYEDVYRPGDSVLAVLKDLKRLWRKDDSDDERTVARCMARAGLMKELIALLVECAERGEWGRKVSLVACEWMEGPDCNIEGETKWDRRSDSCSDLADRCASGIEGNGR